MLGPLGNVRDGPNTTTTIIFQKSFASDATPKRHLMTYQMKNLCGFSMFHCVEGAFGASSGGIPTNCTKRFFLGNRLRFLCGNDAVAVAMRFAMKNGKICFSLRKFLPISPAIQKIASDCGCDAVVLHLAQRYTLRMRVLLYF